MFIDKLQIKIINNRQKWIKEPKKDFVSEQLYNTIILTQFDLFIVYNYFLTFVMSKRVRVAPIVS